MTREDRVKKCEEIRAEVDERVSKLNAMERAIYNKEAVDAAEKSKVEAELNEKVADYKVAARALCYEDCQATENPMLEAVKVRRYECIGVKPIQEEGCPVEYRVEPKLSDIDLLDMNKRVTDGIGCAKNWPDVAQKMNFLLTVGRAKDLGVAPDELTKIRDCYRMTEIAREFDMGKNPVSNTNMLKTLRTVIAGMLGEEYRAKVLSTDVRFLQFVYSKKGKGILGVAVAKHKPFVGYLADVCHHIVTGNPYTIEGWEAKKK